MKNNNILKWVRQHIKPELSGDAFGPTTGFLDDPTENLDIIAGYNNCDMGTEESKEVFENLRFSNDYFLYNFFELSAVELSARSRPVRLAQVFTQALLRVGFFVSWS